MATPPEPAHHLRPESRTRPGVELDLPGLVRRARRVAGLSVRAMAAAAGLSPSTIARAETGEVPLRVDHLAAVVAVAGLRLALLDPDGREQLPMRPDAARDRSGRRLPAHVDVRHSDEVGRIEEFRRDRPVPWFSYSRGATPRDDDHPAGGPASSPDERARARRRQAEHRRRRDRALREATRHLLIARGLAEPEEDPVSGCGCPPGCTEMLLADGLHPALQRDPHVDDCACRCDIH